MTGHTAQELYFKMDKMNNRKLQKSQQFIPDPSNAPFCVRRLGGRKVDSYRQC